LVGNPVDGPARWLLTTTRGSSVLMARPSASVLSATPGPELEVTPSAPAQEAPMAEQMAAISSSAWKVTTPRCRRPARVCNRAEAGVIGYDPRNRVSDPGGLRTPAIKPYASASVPLTVR
jgi:hypothetical protein